MKKLSKLFLVILCFSVISSLYAQQINMPAPSPLAKLEQRVGLTDITITYSRPGVKDRVIFGDLVPYDKLWRTGANMATKISFSDDVKIEGKELKAGEYALFSIPGKEEWTLIFNTDANQPGASRYDESKDALRVKVKSYQLPENINVETFTMDINNIRNDWAYLQLLWEQTIVVAKVEVEVDSRVVADIERVLDPASDAGNYYMAAVYYFETDRDINQAIEWISKSNELSPGRFWVVHQKAKMLQKAGKCKEAVKTAKESIELAKKAGNDDYVKLNEKLIASCK